jgi:hypothetical protein
VPSGLRVGRGPHHLGAGIHRPLDQDAVTVTLAPGAVRPASLAVTDLHDLGQLQTRFNADQGMPRLVLAPT